MTTYVPPDDTAVRHLRTRVRARVDGVLLSLRRVR